MITVLLPILIIIVLVVINGIFVAGEFALVAARRSRLQTMADEGSRAARWLLDIFDRPTGKDSYIAIAQLGITLASVGLGMYGEPAVAAWLYGPIEDMGLSNASAHTIGFIIALSAITFLHVVLGEMIPKALALQLPEQISIRVNPIMRLFGFVFRPFIVLLNSMALGLMRLFRIPEPDSTSLLYTNIELSFVTDEAAEVGLIDARQRDLVRNILTLEEHHAGEIMTPRHRIDTVNGSMTTDDLLTVLRERPRSRYPVIDGDLDQVIGLLHVKDVAQAKAKNPGAIASELARPIPSVLESTDADELLALFKQQRVHAAIVIDEFGGTVGLVTLEDVLEEIVEPVAPPTALEPESGRAFDGSISLADLRDRHGIELHHDSAITLGGFVLAELGRIPVAVPTPAIEAQGYRFTVCSVEGARIGDVQIVASH